MILPEKTSKACLFFILITLAANSCMKEKDVIPAEPAGNTAAEKKVPHALSSHVLNVLALPLFPQHISQRILDDIEKSDDFFNELLDVYEDDPGYWILVDKNHSLGSAYEPYDLVDVSTGSALVSNRMLRKAAYDALNEIFSAAADEGLTLTVLSAYRSYEYQGRTYTYWVVTQGQAEADRISARPGHSQHQLGLTVDLNMLDNELALTPEGIWLAANAVRFGWSLSYPDGYEQLTGYSWESWHHRYVGKRLTRLKMNYFDGIQQYMLVFIHELYEDLRNTGSRLPLTSSVVSRS